MQQYDLIIIGSGASGLMAGIRALKEGIKNVIIFEREDNLGGNLNLFINNGFGEFYLGEKVTGPEFSSILIKEYIELGGQVKTNTKVLNVNEDKEISYISPTDGLNEASAKAIILASGCREKFTGNIRIPIHKYTGIFTTSSAHRLINFQGFLPGKEVVVTGSSIWSFILARRLVIEGAKVKAIVTRKTKVNDDYLKIIQGFNIDVLCKTEISEVGGSERIEWVRIENMLDKNSKMIYCDSLILSIGYYPDIDYIKDFNIEMKGNYPVHNNFEISREGIFGCGTVIYGMATLLSSGEDGYKVGKIVADRIRTASIEGTASVEGTVSI